MALKPCRECKTPVSTSAKSCPQCGVPKPTAMPPSVGSRILGLLLAAGIAWVIFHGGSDKKSAADSASAQTAATQVAAAPAKSQEEIAREQAAKDAACRQDLDCWTDKNQIDAM